MNYAQQFVLGQSRGSLPANSKGILNVNSAQAMEFAMLNEKWASSTDKSPVDELYESNRFDEVGRECL